MFKRAGLYFIILASVACGEPDYNFVFLVNNTDQPLSMVARFRAEQATSSTLDFTLKAGQKEAWRYFTARQVSRPLDTNFESLSIQTSDCKVLLNREDLLKAAKQEGAWVIYIEPSTIVCHP